MFTKGQTWMYISHMSFHRKADSQVKNYVEIQQLET